MRVCKEKERSVGKIPNTKPYNGMYLTQNSKKKFVGREEKRIRKGSDRKGEKDERDDKYTE